MKEINDFLLSLFTSSDDLRPAMMFPNLSNGIVYASDAYVLIAIPETELSLKYKTNEKYPNSQKLIDQFEAGNITSIKVKVPDMAKELAKARFEIDKRSLKCDDCDGTGEVEWEYTSKDGYTHEESFDCPVCYGKGEFKRPHSFARVRLEMMKDEKTGNCCGISIGELYFHPFQLYRLFMVALMKGVKTIDIFFDRENYGQALTSFGDTKVLVMAISKNQL